MMDNEMTGVPPTASSTTNTSKDARSSRTSSNANRMRNYRRRKRHGLRCLALEIRETEVDALIGKGLLVAEERQNNCAVVRALYRFLDAMLGNVTP
jgi:hypothetical protein